MTIEEDVLRRVVALLEQTRVSYMVTGSIAASYYGRPRATHDADVVIDPDRLQVDPLLSALEAAGFYLNPESARIAIRDRRQFNVIDIARATKVDLIVRKARPFSVEEFGRRRAADFAFGQGVMVVSPEDAVLSKLEWARESADSERQLRDVAGILDVSRGLDREYIERWAAVLDVGDLWRRVIASRPEL